MKPRQIFVGRLLATFLLASAGFILVVRFTRDSDRYWRQDFSRYYADTRALNNGSDIYLRSNTQISYPPAFYLAFSPLTWIDRRRAHTVWELAQVLSLLAAVALVLRESDVATGYGFACLAFAFALIFPPFQTAIHYGQPTPLLLLLLVGSWVMARHDADRAAGALLAAAVLLKAFPWPMALYFAARRRWAVLAAAATFALIIEICLLWRYGTTINLDFFLKSRVSEVWLERPRNLSLLSNVRALVFAFRPTPGLRVWAEYALVLLASLALIYFAAEVTRAVPDAASTDGLCWSLWIITTILLAPVAWDHYLVLFLPAYIFVACYVHDHRSAIARRGTRLGALLVLVGLLGFLVVPYFTAMKNLRLLFCFALASYAGLYLMLSAGQGVAASATPALRGSAELMSARDLRPS
ncbi:MAG TPA: glycosyltransferase family 87 protein [Candidatus Binataceae bacterium]|nr:glycosyltransferase family 87 protein [Candidatus Binataceae bacterium]